MANGLITPDEIIGETFIIEDGDDGQLKLRKVGSKRTIYIAASDHELLISEGE